MRAATATDTELRLWGHLTHTHTLIPPPPLLLRHAREGEKRRSRSVVQTGQLSHSVKYDISEKSWKKKTKNRALPLPAPEDKTIN